MQSVDQASGPAAPPPGARAGRAATTERRRAGSAGDLPPALSVRYRAEADLGSGTQAHVVRAHDTFLHRPVAIKLFPCRAAATGRAGRRQHEAHLLASLNHRALTTLYDAGTDHSDPHGPCTFLIMEYVDGPDLRQQLQTGAIDPLQACWLGHDLSDALDCLHAAGFLHRDVKPANVLLVGRGPTSRLRGKLTDFGISALVDAPHTPGRVTGTAAYLAPEQVEDLSPSEASDVYSLGLVLLESLTGAKAFPGEPHRSAFARLDRGPRIPAHIPPPVAALLEAMTARVPADRPSAAAAAERFRDLAVEEAALRRTGAGERPERERARVAAVERYHILDTPPEDAFDDLTALAARVLHVPAALIAIADRDRIWFKSRHDLAERELDRNTALCSLTDPGAGPWSVPDAAADPRTRDDPLVVGGPRIRGYAAAPLRTGDGHTIGSFSVFDTRPREFGADDLTVLAGLAAVVMRELELRLASRRAVFHRRAADPVAPIEDR